MKKSLLCYCLMLLTYNMQAQALFDEVISVLENNGCTNGYCHGGNAGGLDLSGSASEIYDNLVGISPQNETALAKNNLLVDPGYPERSFLYRKINQGLYHDSELTENEGNSMPPSGTEISNRDKEVIRQWIYYGAKETGNAMGADRFAAMEEYHTDGGIGVIEQPPVPAPEEGFQVHLGPVFLPAGDEVEYLKKYALQLDDDVEVNRIECFMNDFSHHFILYKFPNINSANNAQEGLRSIFTMGNEDFVSIWQDNQDYRLPEGTAYFWDNNEVLDLNYHIRNYSSTSVLAGDVYFNVYTQPAGTAVKEMISDLVINYNFVIPNDNTDYTITDNFNINGNINLWMLSSHTHQYGKDFDIYLGDDNTGLQLFEGFYNTAYTAYTGEYDYAHPPVRYFDNFLELPNNTSLTQETVFNNDGESPVSFGVTTNDEMMIAIVQYTVGDTHQEPTQLNELASSYCITDGPIELLANFESGVIGSGVIGNYFYPDQAGIGSHMLVVDCCDEATMTEIMIEVVPGLETPEIDLQENVLSTTIEGDFTYQWNLNGEAITGATSATYDAMESGDYSLTIGNSAGCSSTSITVMASINTALEQIKNLGSIAIYPNPFEGKTTVEYSLKDNANVIIEVYDIKGQKIQTVLENTQDAGIYKIPVDLSNQASGVYFVQLNIDGQLLTQKIIAQ